MKFPNCAKLFIYWKYLLIDENFLKNNFGIVAKCSLLKIINNKLFLTQLIMINIAIILLSWYRQFVSDNHTGFIKFIPISNYWAGEPLVHKLLFLFSIPKKINFVLNCILNTIVDTFGNQLINNRTEVS